MYPSDYSLISNPEQAAAWPAGISSLLQELRTSFQEMFGDSLISLLLYGSYARGDAHEGSDIDILIVLSAIEDYGKLLAYTSEKIADISLRYDRTISRAFISQERFEQERSPFLLNVQAESIAI